MKKSIKSKDSKQAEANEILPKYDFSPALPNKYASRYAAGNTEHPVARTIVFRPQRSKEKPSTLASHFDDFALASLYASRASFSL
jgi:hypothetical protein